MNTIDVTFVRIYMTESSHLLNKMVQYLKAEATLEYLSTIIKHEHIVFWNAKANL